MCSHRTEAKRNVCLCRGKEDGSSGGGDGGTYWKNQTPSPVPTQTPALPHPRRDHPPLAFLLTEHSALRPPWAPGGCSRATLWCGLRFRGPLWFKITHQRWGGVQEEAEEKRRARGQVCTHGHMFSTSLFGFNAAWLRLFRAEEERPDSHSKRKSWLNNVEMCKSYCLYIRRKKSPHYLGKNDVFLHFFCWSCIYFLYFFFFNSWSVLWPRRDCPQRECPNAHLRPLSLHLSATSRRWTGVQNCTESHAVSPFFSIFSYKCFAFVVVVSCIQVKTCKSRPMYFYFRN